MYSSFSISSGILGGISVYVSCTENAGHVAVATCGNSQCRS